MELNLFKKKIQYDFFDSDEFDLVFKHNGAFRINQFNILSWKYDLSVPAVYSEWRYYDRCSYIKLEQILKVRGGVL